MIQLQFLNFILSSKDKSLISLNNLTEDYFCDFRSEFNFIENHIKTYDRVPDIETFLSRFPDFDVIEVNESESYLISALVDDYNTGKLNETFKKIAPLVKAGRMDEAIDIYKKTAENLNKGVSLKSVDILRDNKRLDEYIKRTQNHAEYFFSTGFRELDSITGGFDRKEELAVVVARPGVGKSLISLKFAIEAAKEGLNVGLYSGEMSDTKVGYRADTLIGHINNGGIMHGNEMFLESYTEFMEKLPTLYEGKLNVITPDMVDGPISVNTLKTFVDKENLDLLVVDQISLLEEKRGKSQKEKLSKIMADLKSLQTKKLIPIIVVSQQNREKNDDGSTDLTQIADADEIGRYATIVIFVEKKDDIMKLKLIKNRDGVNGQTLSYQTDINKGYFTFIPEDDSPVSQEEAKSFDRVNESNGDYFE